jgi:prepilin-type N-terminal cleavage/methylation domain-containing protein
MNLWPILRAVPVRSKPLRAFTLLELVLAIVILSLIVAACGSVGLMAVRTLNACGGPDPLAEGRAAADAIAADLRMALAITEQTPTAITFTVPDRNGDGSPETIRYAWSGAGMPLTRQVNGAPVPAAPIAQNVQVFDLQYLTRTAGPPPPAEGSEAVLVCYDNVLATQEFGIQNTTWVCQSFKPVLPGNAVSWKVTRVRVQLRGATGSVSPYSVEFTSVDANQKPMGLPLETVVLDTANIPATPTWIEVPFRNLSGLDPNRGYGIVVKQTAQPSVTYFVRYDDGALPLGSRLWCTTTDAGGSWGAPEAGKAMQFYVYGTVTTQGQ